MMVKNRNTQQGFDLKDSDCSKEFASICDACTMPFPLWALSQGGRKNNAGWYFA